MTRYREALGYFAARPQRWLVTGVAGFIGSNLLERLLRSGQTVVGLDNFSTGYVENLDDVRRSVGEGPWKRFRLIQGDVAERDACLEACRGVDIVLHQAALGSVPRSIQDPVTTNRSNVDGFVQMLAAACSTGVRRFVYAGSSSTYGDSPNLPKVEDEIGRPLSPYAVTKLADELYASVFHRTYGLATVGLRYFNVFGRRQDPNGAYAAVIPAWIGSLLDGRPCSIHGDGETTRDFCYVENVVQANLLAASAEPDVVAGEVFNVAVGARTTLNELFASIRDGLARYDAAIGLAQPQYTPFRVGDIRDSLADLTKISTRLGYRPTHSVQAGLTEALSWYVEQHRARGRFSGPAEPALPVTAG